MRVNGHYSEHGGAAPQPCAIVVAGHRLYLYIGDRLLIWNLKDSFLERRGSVLVVRKGEESLECDGDIAAQVEHSLALAAGAYTKEKFKWKSVHSFFLLLGLMIVVGSLFVYFFAVPWLAEKAAVYVPHDIEVQLGEKIAETFTAGTIGSDSVNYYASRFVRQLDLDTEYPVEVRVLRSDEINAFALPGGKIFIYSGLLEKMDSPGQLVALIGHELTHVTMQHSLKSILRGAASGIVLGGMVGDVGGMGTWLVSKADEFKQLHYSRELETEADDLGVALMVKNSVAPKGMLQLLSLLKAEGAETPELMKYLSTHPDTEERIRRVTANPELKLEFPIKPGLQQAFTELKNSLAAFK